MHYQRFCSLDTQPYCTRHGLAGLPGRLPAPAEELPRDPDGGLVVAGLEADQCQVGVRDALEARVLGCLLEVLLRRCHFAQGHLGIAYCGVLRLNTS